MSDISFEAALDQRTAGMLEACTRCGKCVEACPSVAPAGIADANPKDIIAGVLDIVRTGDGALASRTWAAVLHGQRRLHRGVRLRRQSALPAGDGAPGPGQGPEGTRRAAPRRAAGLPGRRPGRGHALAPAARPGAAGAARTGAGVGAHARGAAGLRVLHRLQRAQDAAHRAHRPRHHGCARHQLPGDGRAEPLLRHHALESRRRRDLRAHGGEHRREAVALEVGPGALLVPELLCAVHRDHAADAREAGRLPPLRDDAVHPLPARAAR